MQFRDKIQHIKTFDPDILVISECELRYQQKFHLEDWKEYNHLWVGKHHFKGLGVLSKADIPIRIADFYDDRFRFVLPVIATISGLDFLILAAWAQGSYEHYERSYLGHVYAAAEYYFAFFTKFPSIYTGDFNSNCIWDKSYRQVTHAGLVKLLQEANLESLYHYQTQEEQGKESAATLFMYRHRDKPYHIDYVFIPKEWCGNSTLSVLSPEEWLRHSDHVPLIADIDVPAIS